MLVGLSIVVLVMLPMATSFWRDSRLCRASYYRALAMEIVDGEMEVLMAGEWKRYTPGHQSYSVQSTVSTNLPRGDFWLTLTEDRVRLEWKPRIRHVGGLVVREAAKP
jgi:hypothetical protein